MLVAIFNFACAKYTGVTRETVFEVVILMTVQADQTKIFLSYLIKIDVEPGLNGLYSY